MTDIFQLWLRFAVLLKILELGIALLVLVRKLQAWRNEGGDSWAKFLCAYGILVTIAALVWFFYQYGAEIWNLFGYQLDDNNHHNTTALYNIRESEAGA
ncbi:hypothetical protein BVG19_g5771 [[Candida] boidinii]|nr:hypothetical protein BVG19_g5771 [[Candida] boidinii]OWB53266.1 hypothetical protein B5S27_g4859 [[Candida] boidinii]